MINENAEIGSTTIQGVFVNLIREIYPLFKRISAKLADRVLKAFGYDPIKPSEKMNWNQFLNFKRILVQQNARKDQTCAFIVKFFSNLEPVSPEDMSLSEKGLYKVLKLLTSSFDKKFKQVQKGLMFKYLKKKMFGAKILQKIGDKIIVNSQELIDYFYWNEDNMSEFFYFALGLYNKWM